MGRSILCTRNILGIILFLILNLLTDPYGSGSLMAGGLQKNTNSGGNTPPPPCTFSLSITASNVSCNGYANGTTEAIVMGGTPPYSYVWNNAISGGMLSNLAAGTYYVAVTDSLGCTETDSVELTEPPVLASSYQQFDITCFGAKDGSIQVTSTGGTAPYQYSWSHGVSGASLANLEPGTFSVRITDSLGCEDSLTITLSEPLLVTGTLTVAPSECGQDNGKISVQASGGIPPYTYNWSNGASGNMVYNLDTGSYTVTITDSNNCTFTDSAMLKDSVEAVDICLVTVDDSSQLNLIIWEKTAQMTIREYHIYKETATAGVYQLLATVPQNGFTTYLDTTSSPMVNAEKYKISAEDTCGNESVWSAYHKTILLTATEGTSGEFNLSWTPYEGTSIQTYLIYRSDSAPVNFVLIDSVAGNQTTYTDPNPAGPSGLVWYMIQAIPVNACNPAKTRHAFSFSNAIKVQGKTSSLQEDDMIIQTYPNPVVDELVVFVQSALPVTAVGLFDVMGQQLSQTNTSVGHDRFTLDLEPLPTGVYLLQIEAGGYTHSRKIIKL